MSRPQNTPVKRAVRGAFDAHSTVNIRPNEIASSAVNAAIVPNDPGIVTANRTCGSATAPIQWAVTNTPAIAPANCART
jgi:hypothetical protein